MALPLLAVVAHMCAWLVLEDRLWAAGLLQQGTRLYGSEQTSLPVRWLMAEGCRQVKPEADYPVCMYLALQQTVIICDVDAGVFIHLIQADPTVPRTTDDWKVSSVLSAT